MRGQEGSPRGQRLRFRVEDQVKHAAAVGGEQSLEVVVLRKNILIGSKVLGRRAINCGRGTDKAKGVEAVAVRVLQGSSHTPDQGRNKHAANLVLCGFSPFTATPQRWGT